MINVFISYGHTDNSEDGNKCMRIAYRLKNDLENCGKYNVFFDEDVLRVGDWEKQITNGIEMADYFLFLVSKKSTSLEGYCLNELSRACELKKVIIPVLLDDSFVPLSITRLQRIFFNSALGPDGAMIEEVYGSSYGRLTRILDGEEELGLYNTDFDIANDIQAYDAYEILSHINSFFGREFFFDEFSKWVSRKDSSSVFVLTATPGAGKSSIASMLTVKFPNNVAAIHFCCFNNSEKNNPKNIIKNLASQLCYRNADFHDVLSKSLKKYGSLEEVDEKRLFEIFLLEPASHTTFKENQVLIIDALDEAIMNNTNRMAELIVSFQTRLPPWMKFFCTSRPRKEVTSFFAGLFTVSLDDYFSKDNTEDIKNYYKSKLNGIDDKKLSLLLEKTEGSFLYAKNLVQNILSKELSISEIDDFPQGISAYYHLWFDRVFRKSAEAYENAKSVLSLIMVCDFAITPDFLQDATGLDNIGKIIETLSDFFSLNNGFISPYHKSIIDWLGSAECPSEYYIDKKFGYLILYDYIIRKRQARGWKKNPYVLTMYCVTLRSLSKYDELCELLKDKGFHLACARSERFAVYETLFEYLNNLKFLYECDEEYAGDVYDSQCFIDVFSKYRMKLYNSGLFIKLKECGFTDYLKNNYHDDKELDYDFGVMHYFYISLSFIETKKQIERIREKYEIEELDPDHRSELKRLMMLVYRKTVEFDKLEEISHSTINDARAANNKFEESLAYLTLSKMYCRELNYEKCREANDTAIRILKERIEEDENEDTKLSDTLFLAEDYRVYADSMIWHKDFETAKEMLIEANKIYARYNTYDRYYQRFLYTTMFFETMRYDEESRVNSLIKKLNAIMKGTKDDYDEAQIAFFESVFYCKCYSRKQDVSLLEKAKERLNFAIRKNKKMSVELERLEAEVLYNLCEKKLGNPPAFNGKYNKYTDAWIDYVTEYLEAL